MQLMKDLRKFCYYINKSLMKTQNNIESILMKLWNRCFQYRLKNLNIL